MKYTVSEKDQRYFSLNFAKSKMMKFWYIQQNNINLLVIFIFQQTNTLNVQV